jgi:acylpyruvate hydrolase
MRLVTLRTAEGTRAGRVEGDEIVELDWPDVAAVLAANPDLAPVADLDGARRPLDGADLAPLVPRPSKIICLGLNYASHIKEMGRELPKYPTMFAKFPRALIGAYDDITLPLVSDETDWEVELAFVIGRPVRHASAAEAEAAIAGYTVMNDVSVRDWQNRTIQFLQGKFFEGTTPLGPALVTADELPGGSADDLVLRTEVDGQVMQDGKTSDLLFKPVDIVRYVSQIATLDPGDVIATGTPSGVGAGRSPKVFLEPGQTVRTTIEGVGELRNTCVKETRG